MTKVRSGAGRVVYSKAGALVCVTFLVRTGSWFRAATCGAILGAVARPDRR